LKVQKQVYHLIGNLLPAEGAQPEFSQIYFISHADEMRSNLNPTFQIDLIDALQTYLHDHNMYIQHLYNFENRPTNDFKLIIHADDMKLPNKYQGRYNEPIVDEVDILLIDKGLRDIVLNARDGRLQQVSEIHRSYYPLQYPLLFPFGND